MSNRRGLLFLKILLRNATEQSGSNGHFHHGPSLSKSEIGACAVLSGGVTPPGLLGPSLGLWLVRDGDTILKAFSFFFFFKLIWLHWVSTL